MNEEISGGEYAAVEAPKNDFIDPDATQEETKPEEKAEDASKDAEDAKAEAAEVADEAEADESEASSEDNQDLKAKKPKKGGFQKKIGRLEKQNAELQARLDAIEQRKGQEADPSEEKRPELDDFDDWDEFNRASVRYEAKQLLKEEQKQQNQKQAEADWKASLQKKAARFEQQKEELREAYDDFDDVIDAYDGGLTPAMEQAILDSEISGEVAYYLAKNPDEAKKMLSMDIISANRFVGRLEAKLEKSEKRQVAVKKTTNAPKPVAAVKPAAKSDIIDFENCTHEEYEAYRARQRGG